MWSLRMSRWIDADKNDKKGRASRALSYYRYQTTADSAVSSNAFRNAENAQRNLVAVKPEQFAKAQVIPHPEVNPTPRAIMAGNQAAHPPVSAQRSAIMQHSPMVRPGQPPTTARSTSPPPPEHNHHYRSHARQHAASGQSIRELRCCPTSSCQSIGSQSWEIPWASVQMHTLRASSAILERFRSCCIQQAKAVEPRFSAASSRSFLKLSRVLTRRQILQYRAFSVCGEGRVPMIRRPAS